MATLVALWIEINYAVAEGIQRYNIVSCRIDAAIMVPIPVSLRPYGVFTTLLSI
jgi:hypothetical protein